MKKLVSLVSIALLSVSLAGFANEPGNIAVTKQKLRQYHDSGAYQNDIANVMQKAMRYLELRVTQKNFRGCRPAIVLDIDETSLSNYPDMDKRDFGGLMADIQADEDQGKDAVISPTLKLYRFAKANKVAVFFVTGRTEEERRPTEANLKAAGFTDFDGLILRNHKQAHIPADKYKIATRKQLASDGYLILLNIGDQMSDLRGGYADKTFKLPNPYYFIP